MSGSNMQDTTMGSSSEPIAIIGIGCRFPGECSAPSKLWDLLYEGKSAQSDIPKNRFDVETWYHPDSSRPGSISTRGGYFLSHDESFRQFDPSFFGISPLEAASMDPQQRKLLEVVYESFESAGATLQELSGSKTSCYIGCFTHDVASMNSREAEYGMPYQMTGSDMTILSNRVNYVFNLKGPSLTVDTACSSSLYALHLACQGLISGDANAAVVGGTNVILGVEQHIASVRLGILSPTSTCHTFDECADGFGRGEGICAIYLKKLSTAIAHGDTIRAVIRSTAINSNGKSQGINHPSSDDQEKVIRAAYASAGLCYNETRYFEAHGTGTPVGDPIEVAAIAKVFASSRTSREPLYIGSIKTNIGHTEGASGLAGVVKAVLSIENNCLPATVGLTKLNPAIDFQEGRLEVVKTTRPWPDGSVKRVSINSFGYGGANAHCIVEAPEILLGLHKAASSADQAVHLKEFDERICANIVVSGTRGHHQDENSIQSKERYLLVFSAHDEPTLSKNIIALSGVANNFRAQDIAYTLSHKRTKHTQLAFTTVSGTHVASQLLPTRITKGSTLSSQRTELAFVFTGQGAQWPKMGYTLTQQYPIVRKTIEDLQAALDRLPTPPEWRILDELSKSAEESQVQLAALSQPLCTAVQVALTVLLTSWGIKPKAVVGHSSGEVAAAFAAGLMTADEAITVAYYRGISVAVCHIPGAMMAVGLGAAEVLPYVENRPDIVIACQNSPQSVTLSGGDMAIDEIQQDLTKAGIFARKLNTSNNAYHSHLVKAAGQYYQKCFESSLPGLLETARSSIVPMYSCINGKTLESQNDVGIQYWRSNLENPVLFTQAISNLVKAQPSINCLVEIGSHSALAGPIKQIRSSLNLTANDLNYIPSIIRNQDNVENILRLCGLLWIFGYPVDLKAINTNSSTEGKFLPNLPTYQWNYQGDILWSENQLSRQLRHRKHLRHDLLGSRQLGNSAFSPEWRNRLQVRHVPWLEDHIVGDDIIFPAAAYLAMGIEAVTQVAEIKGIQFEGYTIRRLVIKSPLILPREGEVEILFNLHLLNDSPSQEANLWSNFSISSVTVDGKWTEHATGMIALERSNESTTPARLSTHSDGVDEIGHNSDQKWYSSFSAVGLRYGPTFRPLGDIQTVAGAECVTSYINLQSTKGTMSGESRYMVHPTALDGCGQLAIIAAHRGQVEELAKPYLPTVIDNLTLWQTPKSTLLPATGILRSNGRRRGLRSAHGTTSLYGTDGKLLAEMTASLYSLEGSLGDRSDEDGRQPYVRLVWQPDIDKLYGEPIRNLFPNGASNALHSTLSGYLDELGELAIISAYAALPDTVELQRRPKSIQRYAAFIRQSGQSLFVNSSPSSKLSSADREQRMLEIVDRCSGNVPEAALIAHISKEIPAILGGETAASQVLYEDGRLNKVYEHGFALIAAYEQLKNVVKLISHKEPRLRILEVGGGTGGATKPMLDALQANSTIPRYTRYTFTDITTAFLSAAEEKFNNVKNMDFRTLDISKDPLAQGFEAGTYDIILASNIIHATENTTSTLQNCKLLLKSDGRIVMVETTKDRLAANFIVGSLPGFLKECDDLIKTPFLSKETWDEHLKDAGFSGTDIVLDDYEEEISSTSIIVSHLQKELVPCMATQILWLIYHNCPHPVLEDIQDRAKSEGLNIQKIPLLNVPAKIRKGDRVIMTAELEGPLLVSMTQQQMDTVKTIFRAASSIVWLTNGGLLAGKNPDNSLILGMARPIMTEQPSLRISSIDMDGEESDNSWFASIVIQHELDLRMDHNGSLDTELIASKGIIYISRYVVDPVENRDFSHQIKPIPEYCKVRSDMELSFKQVGQVDSFYFTEKPPPLGCLKEDEVLIIPTAYNMGKRESTILKGLQDSQYFSVVCIGIMKAAGINATKYQAGQRLVCFCPSKFDTSLTVKEDLCEALYPEDKYEDLGSSLLPYCTALYCLNNLGRGVAGDIVLIHKVCEPFHIAAVYLAQLLGCKTIVTFESVEISTLFHQKYAILDNCHCYTASAGLRTWLASMTAHHGVDLALVSSQSADVPEIWSSLAKNGRFIFPNSSQIPDFALFDPSKFVEGASISCFQMLHLIKNDAITVGKLLRRILILLRDESIPMIPSEGAYDISDLPIAIGAASQPDLTSSITLQYNSQSLIPTNIPYEPIEFSASASYFMIGCLGGLGRSLVSWMVTRGARYFIFLSRSGADKPEARSLIAELESFEPKLGEAISVTIVRGDVGKREDVRRAISMAKRPIRGVMQQAMDDPFDLITLQDWQAGLDAKVQGSINLHEALINEPLDFFVMTSSVVEALGAASFANYAAANVFMDYLARHRWGLGLEACAIALGMIVEVGHVAAHPEIEKALRRGGMYGIPENEYLRMMEAACRRRDPKRISWSWDNGAQSHLVTGMEPGKAFVAGGTTLWSQDHRVRNLGMVIAGVGDKRASPGSQETLTSSTLQEAANANGEVGVKAAIQDLVIQQFSRLVLVPAEKLLISVTHPLMEFGLDSMVISELRSWAWKELKADIPFMGLFERGMSMRGLVEIVWDKMDHSLWQR